MVQTRTIQMLSDFQRNVNGMVWQGLWIAVTDRPNVRIARHLWTKYMSTGQNLLDLWTSLDPKNKSIVISMINKYSELRRMRIDINAYASSVIRKTPT